MITTGSSLASPAAIRENICSSVPRAPKAALTSLSLALTIRSHFARRISPSTVMKSSPPMAFPADPALRPESTDRLPRACCHDRRPAPAHGPTRKPATKTSPTFRVPRCTSTVATEPRPRSMRASTTTPCAARLALAFRSRTSAWRRIASSSASKLIRCLAETSTANTSPPQIFRHQFMIQKFLPDFLGVGAGLVDFIDGDDDRHLGRFGMPNGFNGLRLNAIIGGRPRGRRYPSPWRPAPALP